MRLQASQARITSQQREIEVLKTKLAEEQEKLIELETYSRRENLRFMNIPEDTHENCTDIIYDVIENELDIRTEDIQFQAVHRIGKVGDTTRASPRPIIARFFLRDDRDAVFRKKNKLKFSKKYRDAYITQDYARAVQKERKKLVKAMFIARNKGQNAKVVNRNLVSHAAVICLVTQRSSPLTAAETWTTFLAQFKPITVAVPFSELARAKFSTRDSSNHSLRFIVDLLDSHIRDKRKSCNLTVDKHEITSKEIHGSFSAV